MRSDVAQFPEHDRSKIEEFALFDHGFLVTTNAAGWSFYELRNYIQTYANTWDDDYLLHDSPVHELQTCSEERDFDHEFYVNLIQKIDAVEDRYFKSGSDISHFFDGILKLIRNNLDLYWCAAEYLDATRGKLSYQQHVPSSLSKRDILIKLRKRSSRNLISREVRFNEGEILARLHLKPGPFSPKRAVIHSFLDLVVRHVDDFLHGIVSHAREVAELHREIADLRRDIDHPAQVFTPERERRAKVDIRLVLIGASMIREKAALSIFQNHGFSEIDIFSDYKQIKHLDSNTLLRQRSRYDGILLGPMPHSTKGNGDGTNLIQRILNEPDRYPPSVEVRTNSGQLRITKQSLKDAITNLEEHLQKITQEPLR
ncbi:MAG TPA: hypothetical protein VJ952_09050 [Opitutales bacterium]|nr:hypothetical protein [Opitutales bacterium]